MRDAAPFEFESFFWAAASVMTMAFSGDAMALEGADIYRITSTSIVVIGTSTGTGSGVLMTPQLIATNCHVIGDELTVSVEFFGNRTLGSLVGRNGRNDVCVVRIADPLKGATPVKGTRPWSSVSVGETVYALGAPKGFKYTFTRGVVSQLREHEGGKLVQFDASISPGNSGGGLFDTNGKLIGLPSFLIYGESRQTQNLNFAWSVDVFPDPLRGRDVGNIDDSRRPQRELPAEAALLPSAVTGPGATWRAAFLGGRRSEAVEYANLWISMDPERADAWVALGLSKDAIKRGSGLDAYRKALSCNHSHQLAMYYGALAAVSTGHTHEYRQWGQALRRANPSLAKKLEDAAK